jgi:hypothetical protein
LQAQQRDLPLILKQLAAPMVISWNPDCQVHPQVVDLVLTFLAPRVDELATWSHGKDSHQFDIADL